MNNSMELLTRGLVKENPVFVMLLGTCPALAVTARVETALGMGMLVILVLALSNLFVSLVKGVVPDQIRVPSYIVIIAAFVTMISMLTEAYAYDLFVSLGVFLPLIVVNCIILGRAESFASKNTPISSVLDGIGMGLGFTLALVIISSIRELLSSGTIVFGEYLPFFPSQGDVTSLLAGVNVSDYGIAVLGLPAGAFMTVGFILAIRQGMQARREGAKA
jgi:Na+-translocating ferredoxin:NAD+ oxidoreductase subunit E